MSFVLTMAEPLTEEIDAIIAEVRPINDRASFFLNYVGDAYAQQSGQG